MKRFSLILLVVVLMLTGCAPKAKVASLKWLTENDPTVTYFLAQKYRAERGVTVDVLLTQSPDGTTSEIQAMFATGTAPDIYTAYGGRTATYYDIAFPVKTEEDKYIKGILDVCKNKNGQVVAIPFSFWTQNGSWNVALAEKYGLQAYGPKGENRTLSYADLEAAAKILKAKGAKDEYAAYFYASSGSGDYWMQLFEKGFGANPLYDKDGKLQVNTPEMKAAWQWEKDMVANGYAPAGPEGLNDDMYVTAMVAGKLLFCGDNPILGETAPRIPCSYPTVDGKTLTPFAVAPSCSIALTKEAIAFVEWLGTQEIQVIMHSANLGNSPTRTDVPWTLPANASAKTKESFAWMQQKMAEVGVMNIGIGSPSYGKIRTLRAQKLAEAFAGKDVGTALAEFQAEGEAILAK
jgi:ABC-type glycerol-3-phosphate transport system substrate-binding protein